MNITFEKGIPGFEDLRNFEIQAVQENPKLTLINCIEDKRIGFVSISPFEVEESYDIELNEETIKELDIKKPEEVMILNLITLGKTLETSTVNLKAPIIVNVKNNKGKQLILQQDEYDTKHPLIRRGKHASNY